MAIRIYKPTSPGRRGMSTQDFGEITKHEPEKDLLEHKPSSTGRNNYGRITSRSGSGTFSRWSRCATVVASSRP